MMGARPGTSKRCRGHEVCHPRNSRSWHLTASVPAALAASHFLDMQQGWVTDGTALFRTGDGGQQWTRLASSTHFKNVAQLDFVSRTTGWAISEQGLLKTVDGGQRWSAIPLTNS